MVTTIDWCRDCLSLLISAARVDMSRYSGTATNTLCIRIRVLTAAIVGHGRLRGSRHSYAYHRVESPSRLVWRKDAFSIVFVGTLARTAFICSLARDGPTMPSTISTVTVVDSQRRGHRRHGGWRSLKRDSPFECTWVSSS